MLENIGVQRSGIEWLRMSLLWRIRNSAHLEMQVTAEIRTQLWSFKLVDALGGPAIFTVFKKHRQAEFQK